MELLERWASGSTREIKSAPLPTVKPEAPVNAAFEFGCAGKETYPSQKSAQTAQIYREQGGVRNAGMVAYKCRFCAGWHVGHSGKGR